MNNIITLQSGFVTSAVKLQFNKNRAETKEELIRDAIRTSSSSIGIVNPFYYSKDVSDLLEEVRNNNSLLSDFSFRERIYKTAKVCFSEVDFYTWLNLQKDSVYVGLLHKKFLKETIDYLRTGVRSTSISSWYSLLGPKILTDSDRRSPMPTMYPLQNTPVSETTSISNGRMKVLVHWVSLPDGVADIMHFLNTVFGKYENRVRI